MKGGQGKYTVSNFLLPEWVGVSFSGRKDSCRVGNFIFIFYIQPTSFQIQNKKITGVYKISRWILTENKHPHSLGLGCVKEQPMSGY